MRQDAFVNPALLVWARKSINMGMDDAAEKIGTKPERLADWESGYSKPTINQARKMAQVYKRPLASFFLPEPPTSLGFSVPHDFRMLPQDQPRELSPELISQLRRIEYLRDAAINLSDERSPHASNFVGRSNRSESVRMIVNRAADLLQVPMELRETWHNEYDALNGWKNAVERLGVLVMHLDGVEVAEVRGVAIAETLYPLIAVNGKDSPNGRIFTLLHEFVHLMLGASGISNLRGTLRRPRSQDQKVEQFCNQVAGEILVPTQELRLDREVAAAHGAIVWPDQTIDRLSRRFRVSREVIVRRLLILNLASPEFYREKRRQYHVEYAHRREQSKGFLPPPRRILRGIGQPFARIALSAYYREVITGSDLAELLGARIKHVPAVEELLGGRTALTGGDL
jgi:Zn-dependent peptidase ImmA (M78 family)/DNA-binding XRE family transcriptional regulator